MEKIHAKPENGNGAARAIHEVLHHKTSTAHQQDVDAEIKALSAQFQAILKYKTNSNRRGCEGPSMQTWGNWRKNCGG
jgi:hypothetical protein